MITASRSPSLDIDAVEKRKRKYLLKDRQIDREKKRIKRRRREKRKILIEVFFYLCEEVLTCPSRSRSTCRGAGAAPPRPHVGCRCEYSRRRHRVYIERIT